MTVVNTTLKQVVKNRVKEDWIDFMFAHMDPMRTASKKMARVISITDETADIKRIRFNTNRHWASFLPGQYATFRIMIDGVFLERCYSLVSPPEDSVIEIAVKRQPYGKVSNWMHHQLRVGDVVELGDVGGDFVLPEPAIETASQPLLLIAGGSGITPVYSLLCEVLTKDPHAVVTVLYFVNTEKDLAFGKELDALEEKHVDCTVHYRFASDGEGGQFSQTLLTHVCEDYLSRDTFLCGPAGLMAVVSDLWTTQDASARLHKEVFGLPTVESDIGLNELSITLRRSQQELLNSKPNLLESAEEAGARPAHGCRIGMCKTCSCTKVSGVVRDLVTGEVDDQPNTQIRICVSEPLSAVVLDI